MDERFEDKVLVMWTDEKGKSPLKSGSANSFDYPRLKQLNLEIFIHRGGSRYAKVLQIMFHLSGKKHSVVVAGCSAHDWIDFEVPIIKSIIEMKVKGLSYKRILQKLKKEDFTKKITTDPGKKVKTVNIHDEVETNERCNENTTGKEGAEGQSSDVETCQQSSAKVHITTDSDDEESEEEQDDSESDEESIDSDESEYEMKEEASMKNARENTKNDVQGKSTTKKKYHSQKRNLLNLHEKFKL